MREKTFGALPADPEIRALAAACLAATATAAQWRRLETLIAEHPEFADFWVAHAGLHTRLADLLNPQQQSAREAAVIDSPLSAQALPWLTTSPASAPAPHRGRSAGGAVVAAVALVLLVWVARSLQPPAHDSAAAIAWVDADSPPRALRAGDRFSQSAGQTELRFDSGVRLTLSGAADLELISSMVVHLHSGQLQADVGEAGRGFSVLTDSTDVVDLGTVFGVGVNPTGETDVVVFQGEVELNRRAGAHHEPADRRYTTGEAVRVESAGLPTRIPAIWQESSGAQWSTSDGVRGNSIISSVSDNLSTVSRPKFYGVVPGGFREGVKAYADRPHLWAGLDQGPLPADLVGGDYIQTFIADHSDPEIEIAMSVVYPARIYLFVDDRVHTPDWVIRDFANTGQRVALSVENKPYRGTPEYKEADSHPKYGGRLTGGHWQFPFTVWMREINEAGEIHFGPPGLSYTGNVEISGMYGVVVVPLAARQ